MSALRILVAAILVVSAVIVGGVAVPTASPTGSALAESTAPSATAATTATTATAVTTDDAFRDVGNATGERPQTDEEELANASINVLALPQRGANRSSVDRYHVDLGVALGFAANETGHRLDTLATVEYIRSAETSDERQRRILGELNRIEQRVISLRTAQSTALSAFTAGEASARETLIRLARIDAEARSLETRRERIATLASETPEFSVDSSRMDSLERELDAVTGPVRANAAAVLRGESEPGRFYVATADESVVLSTLVGDAYVREAYRGDLRNRSSGQMSPEEAFDIAQRSYPTVWELRNDTEIIGSGDSYLVRVSYSRGDLSAFVDSGSKRVFKEFQRRPLSAFESGRNVSDTRDGLRLTVNRTYAGGPLHVELVEAESGEPVSANITIGLDGEESALVGSTGIDGELWTLSPGSRFTVTAIHGNAVVLVTFEPAAPPRIPDQ